jgi:hypothetical protein
VRVQGSGKCDCETCGPGGSFYNRGTIGPWGGRNEVSKDLIDSGFKFVYLQPYDACNCTLTAREIWTPDGYTGGKCNRPDDIVCKEPEAGCTKWLTAPRGGVAGLPLITPKGNCKYDFATNTVTNHETGKTYDTNGKRVE